MPRADTIAKPFGLKLPTSRKPPPAPVANVATPIAMIT
jgi:hypothetical protein